MKQKLLSFILLCTLFIGGAFAQNRQVSGKVTSAADGSPISGVSIAVVGGTAATQTDALGAYSFSVPENATLAFSYLGYIAQRLPVAGKTTVNVALQSDETALEEVVVTAYGTQTKESIAGSISTLKAKDLEQVQTANVVQSLAGKVGGVQIRSTSGQPGASATVRFRGLGSISSSNDPLYVVDGVPYNGDISAISSQDIDQMSFLKDAAANALYGSRGANGVIIITTKKGKNNNKVDITLDSRVGFNSRATKDYNYITDPSEYYELRWQRLRLGEIVNGASDQDARTTASNTLFSDLKYNIFNVGNNEIIDASSGKINPSAKVLYHDDWNDYLFDNSIRHEHSLNLRYGNDKVTSYLSGGYLKDDGYVINSGFERVSARANLEFRPYEFVKLGGNVNFASTKSRDPQAGKASGTYSNLFSWSRNMAPIYPIFARDKEGNILKNANGRDLYDWGKGETINPDGSSAVRPYITNMNPYASTLLNIQTNTNTNVSLRTYASFDFLKNFNFTYNIGYDFLGGNRLRYANSEGGDAAPYGGSITNALINESTLTNQQLLTYDKKFGQHSLNILVGHESSDYSSKMISGAKTMVVIPNEIFLSNASKFSALNGYTDNYKVEGYLSKVTYNYAGKYYVNGSFRRDGSSVFHPDNRWGNFYGIGGAWIASNEDFLKSVDAISNLKFKISYGEQGNDNLYYPSYVSMDHRNHFGYSRNFYPYMDQFEITADAEGNPSIKQVYTGNKDLKWEVSRNFNTGFELGLFANRLNVDFEFFTRKVSDMLYNFPQAPSSGIPAISKNIGDMKNTGVEISINGDVVRTDDWNLNLWVNATHYKNKITRLPQPFVNGGIFRFVEGQSAYTYYLREFAGVDPTTGLGSWYVGETDPISGLSTGAKTTTQTHSSGTQFLSNKSAHPDVYGGFGFDLRYKKLSFNAGFAYQLGGYVFDNVYQGLFSEGTGMGNSGANYHKDVYKTWTPENTSAMLPILTSVDKQQYGTSDMFLVSANYLSLENFGISYDLSGQKMERIGVKNARVSVLGNNLFMLSKRQGLDPRMMQIGGELNNGLTLNSYSLLRSLSLGLTVNF
ncbi:SusC/RagA family TonB-linked outer membrane protein [Sphingobacterium psychroaquaticum]|uniref:SusC/RagA family TonB-linked outer membrane protein n=1 Tax=Sphingobacterium psychroaquaticum TaxID=561061 RepID=UPI0010694C48|nr:SusC/RagA family TonB-linked outer membrane protein [Sphingobacterium psychroaquaticum]QBQ42568.1 SusC/RagA family TonB-linked outer membrane protein [Sphingobacterium psychroaquaticum]